MFSSCGANVRVRIAAVQCIVMLPLLAVTDARAQGAPSVRLHGGVQAVAAFSRIDPALLGDAMHQARLTQTFLVGNAALGTGWLTGAASINLEGWTLADGELAPGNAGEGYVDKRHPHTFLHEMVLTATAAARTARGSITAGRGFAPFGTDDPMVRPFVQYPTNHHLAQILERWIVVAAAGAGPLTMEAGLFNGDEPIGPRDLGRLDRLADSWAARATVRPLDGLEAQASYAFVASPEFRAGFGLDQRKKSASARFERDLPRTGPVYALVEWAETNEYAGERKLYVFTSVLAEAAVTLEAWKAGLRFERTTRPEEERLEDPFRSARPHTDNNIVGATRWNTITGRAGRSFASGELQLEPYAEAARSRVSEVSGGFLDPAAFYGGDTLWTISFGLRVNLGLRHERMGRYGEALHGAHAMSAMNHEYR